MTGGLNACVQDGTDEEMDHILGSEQTGGRRRLPVVEDWIGL